MNLPLDMFARLPGAQGHRVRFGLEHERGPRQLWADAGLRPGAGKGADSRRPGTPLLPHHLQHRGQNHLLLLPLQPGTASVGCHLHHQVSAYRAGFLVSVLWSVLCWCLLCRHPAVCFGSLGGPWLWGGRLEGEGSCFTRVKKLLMVRWDGEK